MPANCASSASIYDAEGNVSSVTNPLGQATTAVYDAAGQQTSVTNALGQSTSFAFDLDRAIHLLIQEMNASRV